MERRTSFIIRIGFDSLQSWTGQKIKKKQQATGRKEKEESVSESEEEESSTGL